MLGHDADCDCNKPGTRTEKQTPLSSAVRISPIHTPDLLILLFMFSLTGQRMRSHRRQQLPHLPLYIYAGVSLFDMKAHRVVPLLINSHHIMHIYGHDMSRE